MIILQVVLPVKLHRSFDYLPPKDAGAEPLKPGVRLSVPFGKSIRIGLLIGVANTSELPLSRLREVAAVIDNDPVFDARHLRLLQWASDYYQQPLGEVMFTALPVLLRQGRAASLPIKRRWRLTQAGREGIARRSPRQTALLALLKQHPDGLTVEQIAPDLRSCLSTLAAKGWIKAVPVDDEPSGTVLPHLSPNPHQAAAITAILAAQRRFQVFLLEGVTGSGKTEVYLQVVAAMLKDDRQALILVPEISLTDQTIRRFRERFALPIAVFHSGLTEQERLHNWLNAQRGQAAIVIGTRSAVWTPLPRLGVIIVDEEHDTSYKQQEGFRYSARDVAIVRAQRAAVPVILGSATPAVESIVNVHSGRYHSLLLPTRAGQAQTPAIHLLDIRSKPLQGGLSDTLIRRIGEYLERQEQILIFLNRRGYAPLILCHHCGWMATCSQCDARYIYHRDESLLRCHHCGNTSPPLERCAACHGTTLLKLGFGTQHTVEKLQQHFPTARIARIDHDTTRRKGSLQAQLNEVQRGEVDILVGTQMIAKGHHFPEVTLVAMIDADSRLFSCDFRSSERLAQLVLQVAGRAGRGEKPGTVLIQTHYPDHPLLQTLRQLGYRAYTEILLQERQTLHLPPYSFLTLLRAEASDKALPQHFLDTAKTLATRIASGRASVFGPLPAPMERRAGRYHYQLMLQAEQRHHLQQVLKQLIPALADLKTSHKLRWSVDVDPQEMF